MPPSRVPSGVKKERMFLILAVLSKHTDMKPYLNDIHLNVTGGRLRIVVDCRCANARNPGSRTSGLF